MNNKVVLASSSVHRRKLLRQLKIRFSYVAPNIDEKKLKQIDREKKTQRKNRQGIFKVALVGYTNVGKSSLMNKLTGADTLVENKLFATLDSTVRKIKKNFPYPILLSDTVGLINKLPHDLVASFKSTLDEVRNADLLIHVVDISHHEYKNQMQITNNLLIEMEMDEIDVILAFNKTDSIEAVSYTHLTLPTNREV